MARRSELRQKPKKRINRYNPNDPNWHSVHARWRRTPAKAVAMLGLALKRRSA